MIDRERLQLELLEAFPENPYGLFLADAYGIIIFYCGSSDLKRAREIFEHCTPADERDHLDVNAWQGSAHVRYVERPIFVSP